MSLIVSVSGVRGIVGETLTPDVALEFAHGYGTLLQGGRVVLGRDGRPSGEMLMAAAEAGLLAAGCSVTRLGIAMTPTVGRAIVDGGYAGGINITASHNPSQWNGLKFLDDRGLAPDPTRAAEIDAARRARRTVTSGYQAVRNDPAASRRHADAVKSTIELDLSGLRGMRVVLDSVNGAGCIISGDFLRELGCEVIHLNCEPHGNFAHPPEPTEENLRDLCAAVREHGAQIGFAQDPDADRLALVDETGRYIGEEYTLALSTWSVLSRRIGAVAANLSTSRMVDDVAARYGAKVLRTPVGEANVARAIMEHRCVIGGEGNGGVIDPRICLVRDSLSAMSLVLQLMKSERKPLSALAAALPSYIIIKTKVTCTPDQVRSAVAAVEKAFPPERMNRSDGVRIDFDAGWVHIRGSNTEPILRVIAEARDEKAAHELIASVQRAAGLSAATSPPHR